MLRKQGEPAVERKWGIVMKERIDGQNLWLTEGAKARVTHHIISRYLEHDIEVHRSQTTARFGR